MEAPVIEVQGLSIDLLRRGESRCVLSDVNFSLERRGVLGIIGESGSGNRYSRAPLSAQSPHHCGAFRVLFAIEATIFWR